MCSKMSLTNEFRMAMALLEMPASAVNGTSAADDADALLVAGPGLGTI
jgi:hypothetical protein